MKLFLKDINYYFLTCNNPIRNNHILQEFSDYNLIEINPITGIDKSQSGASGFIRILEKAVNLQDKQKPFQPFVVFEDDVKKYREFPITIDIPDDADILYIGLSRWGVINNVGHEYKVCFDNVGENIIRVYNMLSTHGFIICSLRGLLAIQKCMMEAYFKNTVWDIFTSQIQPYYNVYALKIPLVYQYGLIGGAEAPTKIDFVNYHDKPLDKKQINTTNLSIITLL